MALFTSSIRSDDIPSAKRTSMLFFSKFTATSATPSTWRVVLSTREEQAAHDMPVTSNICFSASVMSRPSSYFATRRIKSIASSMTSVSPAWIFSTTQVCKWF